MLRHAAVAALPGRADARDPERRPLQSLLRRAQSHGIARLSPLAPYRYLYPFPEPALADIAYAFDYDCAPGARLSDVAEALERELSRWRYESTQGELRVAGGGDGDDGRMTLLDRGQSRSSDDRAR